MPGSRDSWKKTQTQSLEKAGKKAPTFMIEKTLDEKHRSQDLEETGQKTPKLSKKDAIDALIARRLAKDMDAGIRRELYKRHGPKRQERAG